jgi:hypothetical protein
MATKRQTLAKKWKKEYYRAVDGIVRSHGMQKFLMRILYLICFVATVILSTLLYLNS